MEENEPVHSAAQRPSRGDHGWPGQAVTNKMPDRKSTLSRRSHCSCRHSPAPRDRIGSLQHAPHAPHAPRLGSSPHTHHYLKSDTLVGEQFRYVAEVEDLWLALLSWNSAAHHIKSQTVQANSRKFVAGEGLNAVAREILVI